MLTIKQIEEACYKNTSNATIIKYNPRGTEYYVLGFPDVKQPNGSWVKGVGYSTFSYGVPEYIRIDGQLGKFSLL